MKKKHKYGVTGTGQESERPGGLGRSYRESMLKLLQRRREGPERA